MSWLERLIYRMTGRVLLPKRDDPRDPHCQNCGTYLALDATQWQYDRTQPGVIRVRRDLPCRRCQAGTHCRPSGCPCLECQPEVAREAKRPTDKDGDG